MTRFREHKVRTDAALPTLTPAWSKLDPAPDRFHPGDIAEYRVTFAGRPVHFVASVHYRDGPHFEIYPSSGPYSIRSAATRWSNLQIGRLVGDGSPSTGKPGASRFAATRRRLPTVARQSPARR